MFVLSKINIAGFRFSDPLTRYSRPNKEYAIFVRIVINGLNIVKYIGIIAIWYEHYSDWKKKYNQLRQSLNSSTRR